MNSNKEYVKEIMLPVAHRDEDYLVRPGKIIALGLNYRDHIAEHDKVNVQGFENEVPVEPILFSKTPNVLIGDGETIVIPAFLKDYKFNDMRVDYEAELAFIVKKQCKYVPKEKAYDYILGYTCMNDVSQRNLQTSDKSGWFRGKSLDTFGPIGPCLVLRDDIGDPQQLDITCRLNGETKQQSNTMHMIFSIPEILQFCSRMFTLSAGDIITTGTPSGVGRMKHGDIVEVEIDGIGILRNDVKEE